MRGEFLCTLFFMQTSSAELGECYALLCQLRCHKSGAYHQHIRKHSLRKKVGVVPYLLA